MADKSLQALTSAVYQIAENSPKIQKDVKDIKDAICGTEGILKTLMTISESIASKKDDKDKLVKLDNKSDKISISNSKQLVKKTSSIEFILGKILTRVEKIQGGNGVGHLGKSSVKIDDKYNPNKKKKNLKAINIDDKDDPNKKKKSLDGLSKAINIIEKLRDVKLKDLLFAKLKLSRIKSIMGKFKNIFTSFKDDKEINGTISVANSSIEITEKLSKIGFGLKVKNGEKTVEEIIIGKKGKGGILGIYRKLYEEREVIKYGQKSIKDINKSCGSILLTTMSLTAIGLLSIPAMAGALLMKGVIWLLVCTYKYLASPKRYYEIIKGSIALLKISTSIIAFTLSLGLMTKFMKDVNIKSIGILMAAIAGLSLTVWAVGKLGSSVIKGSMGLIFVGSGLLLFSLGVGSLAKATKGVTLKDVLMMTSLVGGMGLAVALLGLLSVPVALGSASLLLLGTSLLFFALPMIIWKRLDVSTSMGNIKLAVNGLRDIFGLELGKNSDEGKNVGKRLGDGLMGLAMGLLEGGKTFFIMGTILLAGAALGMLYLGLKPWENYTGAKKAIGNVKEAVNGLKEVFGFEDIKADGFGNGLAKIGGGLLDMAVTILQSGKALAQMGTIALATVISDLIRVTLIPWEKYKADTAMKNMKAAINGLKEIFGIKDTGGRGRLKALAGGILDMGIALLQSGTALVQIGVITIATGMTGIIRKSLSEWDEYDPTTALGRIDQTVTSLKTLFGLENTDTSLVGKLGNLGGSLLDLSTTLLNSGSTLMKIGTISLCVGMMNKIKEELNEWEDYNGAENAIKNIDTAVSGLLNIFGLNQVKKEKEADSWLKRRWQGLKKIGQGVEDFFTGMADATGSAAQSFATNIKMSGLKVAIGLIEPLKKSLDSWENFNTDNAIGNLTKSITGIVNVSNYIKSLDSDTRYTNGGFTNYFKTATRDIREGINNIKYSLTGSSIFKSKIAPIEKTVKTVNALDITKASTMIELFKSFSNIADKNFDGFTEAVNKFGEKCEQFENALNNFNPELSVATTPGIHTGNFSGELYSGSEINNNALANAIANAIKRAGIPVNVTIPDINLYAEGKRGKKIEIRIE